MLKIGQIVTHSGSPHIVVFINDCRAILVPAEGRDLDDPNLTIQETAGVNVSPNSELPHIGWIAGRVLARQTVARGPMKAPVQDYGPAPVPPTRKKLRGRPLVMPAVPTEDLPASSEPALVDLQAAEVEVFAAAAVSLQQLIDSSSV